MRFKASHGRSTFEISKITANTSENNPAVTGEQNEKALAGVEILLVEDNPINVFVAKSFLERWGAVIEVAENGLQAYTDVWKEHQVSHLPQ